MSPQNISIMATEGKSQPEALLVDLKLCYPSLVSPCSSCLSWRLQATQEERRVIPGPREGAHSIKAASLMLCGWHQVGVGSCGPPAGSKPVSRATRVPTRRITCIRTTLQAPLIGEARRDWRWVGQANTGNACWA